MFLINFCNSSMFYFQVVITMRDLFQTVFELKKQEIEMTRQQQIMKGSGLYLEALASTASKVDHVSP